MLTRIATLSPQARIGAAIVAAFVCGIIGLAALIVAGAPHAAKATPPIIILGDTPTAAPVAMVAAYAAPGGAQLGDIPADTPIRYRDSRAPGWVGVDWEGGIVWFLADGDTGDLADLAPAPTSTPPPVAEQPAPAQVIYVERPAAPVEVAPATMQLPPQTDSLQPDSSGNVIPPPDPNHPRGAHKRVDLTCVSTYPRPIICTPQGDWHPPLVLPDTHDAQP